MKNRISFTCTCARSYETIMSFKSLFKEGFGGIEIFYPYDMDKERIDSYTKAITDLLDGEAGIVRIMHLPYGRSSDLAKDDDKEYSDIVYKRYFDAIDYAKKFDVDRFTLHLGTRITGNYDKLITKIQGLCDYAYPRMIMIENMPCDIEYGTYEDELDDIFKKVNRSNLKLIYDTGHGHVAMKSTTLEKKLLDDYKDRLYHFHINDNDSSADKHARIGDGNIEFEKLFKDLKKNGYDQMFSLEILYNTVDDLRDYAASLIEILKKVELL